MSFCLVEEESFLGDYWNLSLFESIPQCNFVEEHEEFGLGQAAMEQEGHGSTRENIEECSFNIDEIFEDFNCHKEEPNRDQGVMEIANKLPGSQHIRPLGDEKTVYVRGRKEGSEGKVVEITREILQEFYGQKIETVASHLGVGKSTMKLACRRLGIHKWPYTNKGVRRSADCPYGRWSLKNSC
ncbi:hypothetical protein GUITHDRAFT_117410 [Guillardia theta CCMP2712]|uniref:RWP-RK domain-containing protein n=1 Tax=Guillardia theta (strain CCMP2712) TaxID=905079 RepID=L1IKT9_GUITC|nr:hypothetical protein GUITHDRAFT_117410 [Guillardia theta CCMP2712]EKX36410.1 hypothetical protein GUITHDRAFT_117410 [Guillardia theta CCMP2712]|eukprot:XP_005823390.1 hypothetical protein GUITHDRAFT_117410 [Guillardia theta CCMP2712]